MLGNGLDVLGNGLHMLGNRPHVLGMVYIFIQDYVIWDYIKRNYLVCRIMLFGIRSIRIISHLGLCHIQYSVSWDCVVHVIVTQLTFLKNVIMSFSLISVYHASL